MGYIVKFANRKGEKIAQAWYKDEKSAKEALDAIKKNGGNGIITKGKMNESDAYDNNRYMMKKYGGQILARPDNSNTKDGKDHVYAPNAQIAKQLYKQGKKVYREESDHEVSMARGELEAIADKASQLAGALQGKSDEGNPLEAWVQSKITKAKDYINSVSDYLTYDPSMKQNEETLEEKFALYALKDFMDTKAPGGKRKKGDRVSGSMTYTQAISKAKQMNVGSSVGADKRVEVKPMKEELEEAKIISDISGVGINVIKKEVMPFNVKVGRVGPGMDSDYEVEFIGSEPNLIKYAKKHLDFDGNSFSQLKKHLAMEETEVNEKTYGWTLVSKAKDLAKKFANNMTKAVAEIEKLEKGLSKNPTVDAELRKYNEEIEIDEKISDIFKANKEGESIDNIAKRLKLSTSMVKKLIGEDLNEQDEQETDPDKIALAKEKDTDVLEKQLTAAQGQIAVLKQKIENEKNKAVKPLPNPETGEVPLTIGIAHKVLKDMKDKEAEEKKQKETSKKIQSLSKGEEETKLENFTKKYLSHLNESEASDKAKAMGLDYMSFGRYGKDGKVTHKSVGGSLQALSKKDQDKEKETKPAKPKTKTTGNIKNPDDSRATSGQIKKEILKKIDDEDIENDPSILPEFEDEFIALADDLKGSGDKETADKILSAVMAAGEDDTDTAAKIDDMMNALQGKPDLNTAKQKELSKMTSLYTDAKYSSKNFQNFVSDTSSMISKMGEVADAGSMDSDAYGPGIRSDAMVELVSTASEIQDKIEDMDMNDDIKIDINAALSTITDTDTDEYTEEGHIYMAIEKLKYSFKKLNKQKSKTSSGAKTEEIIIEKAMTDKEKRIQRAKDMIKYYDAQKKAALKGPNKALAKKMLKNDTELEEVTQKEIDKFHTDLDSLVKMDEKVADSIIKDLQKAYAPMKGKRISPEMATKISKHLDQPSYDLNVLRQLKKADIPFISTIARNKIYKKTGKFEDRRLYVEAIAGLQKKADKSGMPYNILKQVYDRGMAAWKSGHRPGASQQQWAFARVNSFITKSSGTWGGADKDLAAKVKGSK